MAVPKISARTLEEHRAETLERLFEAFGELVMQTGYADISLADVAAHAGLARTAIYNYFPDRESLLFAWTEREVTHTLEILQRELAEAGTSAEKLEVFVRAQLNEFMARHLPPGKEAMQFLRPETHERFRHHIEPVENILRGLLAEGVASGEFGDFEAEGTIPLVMACIAAERVPLAAREHDVEDATRRVTDFLLRALTPAGATPKKSGGAKKSTKPRA